MELPWDIKYKPKTLDKYMFQSEDEKQYFFGLKEIPTLLLYGPSGTGKTTLAELLIKHHKIDPVFDVLIINASDENGVDTIRDKIKTFVSTAAISEYKVILLDEADYLSQNAQGILRGLINDYADSARFIFTCNYVDKLIDANFSRCEEFELKAMDKFDIAEYLITILRAENVKFDLDSVDHFINAYYPDVRKIIKNCKKHSHTGTLTIPTKADTKIVDFIENDDWTNFFFYLEDNKDAIDVNDGFTIIYNNLKLSTKFKDLEAYQTAILIIADWMKKPGVSFINLVACVIELSRV